MSKRALSSLLLVFVLLAAVACGPTKTATPKPPTAEATQAVEAATQEATAVVEAATEEATAEVTEAAVEPTEEATAEVTEAAAEPTEEVTAEATKPVVEATEAVMEAATEEATAEATEAVVEPTLEPTKEVAVVPTVDTAAIAADTQATLDAASTEAAAMAGDAKATTDAAMAAVTSAAGDVQATTDAALTQAAGAAGDIQATTDAASTQAAAAVADAKATTDAAMAMATTVVAEATAAMEATVEPTPLPVEATAEAPAGGLIPVRLQLQWVAQSQFAGYYAAVAQGFYKDEGLDVTILEGAVDIVPQQVVASGGAEFGIAWVPKVLASREQGADLVNIAQIFQRSGTLEVSFKDKGITSVADLKGMKVGTWGFGNEHELFAALRGENIDPNNPDDVTIVQQPFDMSLLLNGEVDAAEAMTYNEYAQVLEQKNPATGELYQPDELNVINFNDVGTAMLQDHIFTLGSWLSGETNGVSNEDIAVKFIRASIKGWIYARDHFDETVDVVLANGPTLGKGHMTWQLNEINKLIWPSPEGIGIMDKALWDQTVKVALDGKVITAEPTDGAYRTDLAQKAVDSLKADGVDVTGADYTPKTVEITPGGE